MGFTPREEYGNFGSSQWMRYAVARVGVAMPNCFTYATARISEIVGHNQSLDGNTRVSGAGNLWETHAPEFSQSSVAQVGDLAIYKGGYGNYGHVAVVEVVGVNMAMSQSNYGGNLFDYVEVPKNVGSYYPGTALRLVGFLRHKELGTTVSNSYSEKQLINENGVATLTQDVNKRRDSPTGIVAETLKKGTKLTYTQKWVGNGHRYISFVEHQNDGRMYRYFVAISGSEKQGVDMWATFEQPNDTPSYKLEDEHGWAKYKVDQVQIRQDSPTGKVVGVANANTLIEYTQKCATDAHRYIVYKKDGHNYFVACSPTKDRSTAWCDFYAENPDKVETSKPSIDQSNVKHWGVDLSEANRESDVDMSKYDFAIIQCNYGEKTDNEGYKDKKLDHWVSECLKHNKPFGFYCYDYAYNAEGAKLEAEYAVELAEKYKPTLGIWIDMEDSDDWKKKRGLLTKEHCLEMCQVFCKVVKEAGWYTGVYSSTWWFDNWLTDGLDDYDKWVAQWDSNDGNYNSDTSYRGTIHQYTSIDKATGIGLDKNAMYVDFDHYKVKNTSEKPSNDKPSEEKPSEPQKEPTDDKKENDEQSSVESKKSLLDVLYELLKWILSLFGKKQGDK